MDFGELEKALGYEFQNKELLKMALTHSSYSNEMKAKGIAAECNERAEFLGDAVLSYIASSYLYKNYPKLSEGELTRIRAQVVCERALCEYAQELGLGSYLLLGHGEALSHGERRPSILADAFEALLAAIWLDGGEGAAEKFALRFLAPEIKRVLASNPTDYKSMLQRLVQVERDVILEYVVVNESGPPHKRVFTVEARLNNNIIGRGESTTKREAEQLAAKEALRLFGLQ
ncbi:MAG TPA: ribonuclease III [Bacillota bacterium]|nr:ribonuclease III [Clostridiales bacterium]HPT85853.1 ribonuclease III [Bacillota bacterium]